MPVTISHYVLALKQDCRDLWSIEFEAFIKVIEDNPGDGTAFGVFADWCAEKDEPEFEKVLRWFMARSPSVSLYGPYPDVTPFSFFGLPDLIRNRLVRDYTNVFSDPARALATLGMTLESLRKEID